MIVCLLQWMAWAWVLILLALAGVLIGKTVRELWRARK